MLKSTTLLLAFFMAVLGVAAATQVSLSHGGSAAATGGFSSKTITNRRLEDEPWDQGTRVYKYYEDDGDYYGRITAYHGGVYTVTWMDGETDQFDDTEIDALVEDGKPYAPGAPVALKEDGVWYGGFIIAFDDEASIYTVEWTDGEKDTYAYGDPQVDQMVDDAADDYYALGTPVSKNYPHDGGWWDGTITAYDSDGVYLVTWSDGETDEFDDSDELDQMVEDGATGPHAKKDDHVDPLKEYMFPFGTVVYKEIKGVWYEGIITDYDDGVYTVTWTDGSSDDFDDVEEVDQMVRDGSQEVEEKKRNKKGAKASDQASAQASSVNKVKEPIPAGYIVLVVALVVGTVGIAFFWGRKNLAQNKETPPELNLANASSEDEDFTAPVAPYEDGNRYTDDVPPTTDPGDVDMSDLQVVDTESPRNII